MRKQLIPTISAAILLAGCAGTYQPTSEYPPTPDKKMAQRACLHETLAATPNPFGAIGAIALIDTRQRLTAECMAAHGWVLSE